MKQFKLYKIDKDSVNDVMQSLNKLTYKRISEYIIAVEYDYLKNGYKKILEQMSELDVTQYILTSSRFYNLLLSLLSKDVDVYKVELNYVLEEDNEYIQEYIANINKNKKDKYSIKKLIDMLTWYNYDEGIDIAHIDFGIMINKRICQFSFHNNGVLLIDLDISIDYIFDLLKDIL